MRCIVHQILISHTLAWYCYYGQHMHVQVHCVQMQPLVSWQRDRKWGLGAVCTSLITCTKTLILDALVCTSHLRKTSGNYSCGSLPNQPWSVAKYRSEVVNTGGVVNSSLSVLWEEMCCLGRVATAFIHLQEGQRPFFCKNTITG